MDQLHVEIYVSGCFRNERKSIAAVLPQTPKHPANVGRGGAQGADLRASCLSSCCNGHR
jgi:hypothetical protein